MTPDTANNGDTPKTYTTSHRMNFIFDMGYWLFVLYGFRMTFSCNTMLGCRVLNP